MPLLHFYNFPRLPTTMANLLSTTQPWLALKIFILICLPFNTALAGKIFTDDFESGSLNIGKAQLNGFFWRTGSNATVSTENPKTGSYSLKFFYNGGGAGNPTRSEQAFYLGGNYPDIWIKYDLYAPSNYVHAPIKPTNNKSHVWLWAGDYSCAKGREGPKLGSQWWEKNGGESELVFYASGCVNGKITIQKNWLCSTCSAGKTNNGIVKNDKGRWMTIVIHAKYATKANNDGVYELWKTNWQGATEKQIDIHDGAWYGTQPFSDLAARGFDEGYLLGAANSGFDQNTTLYIDNIEFSTSPLVADSVAAPKPPTIFVNTP